MMMAGSFHPPFSFRPCRKENGPWTVQKKRRLLVRGSRRAAGVFRDGADKTSQSSAGSRRTAPPSKSLPASAVPAEISGWPSHLTSFSFRAVRFAARWPGPTKDHGAAAGREAEGIPNLPGLEVPQGTGVSVPGCRKRQPTFPRRRQEVRIFADRPAETFFLFHRARRIFFLMSQKENGGCIAQAANAAGFPARRGG